MLAFQTDHLSPAIASQEGGRVGFGVDGGAHDPRSIQQGRKTREERPWFLGGWAPRKCPAQGHDFEMF